MSGDNLPRLRTGSSSSRSRRSDQPSGSRTSRPARRQTDIVEPRTARPDVGSVRIRSRSHSHSAPDEAQEVDHQSTAQSGLQLPSYTHEYNPYTGYYGYPGDSGTQYQNGQSSGGHHSRGAGASGVEESAQFTTGALMQQGQGSGNYWDTAAPYTGYSGNLPPLPSTYGSTSQFGVPDLPPLQDDQNDYSHAYFGQDYGFHNPTLHQQELPNYSDAMAGMNIGLTSQQAGTFPDMPSIHNYYDTDRQVGTTDVPPTFSNQEGLSDLYHGHAHRTPLPQQDAPPDYSDVRTSSQQVPADDEYDWADFIIGDPSQQHSSPRVDIDPSLQAGQHAAQTGHHDAQTLEESSGPVAHGYTPFPPPGEYTLQFTMPDFSHFNPNLSVYLALSDELRQIVVERVLQLRPLVPKIVRYELTGHLLPRWARDILGNNEDRIFAAVDKLFPDSDRHHKRFTSWMMGYDSFQRKEVIRRLVMATLQSVETLREHIYKNGLHPRAAAEILNASYLEEVQVIARRYGLPVDVDQGRRPWSRGLGILQSKALRQRMTKYGVKSDRARFEFLAKAKIPMGYGLAMLRASDEQFKSIMDILASSSRAPLPFCEGILDV
ncbi:hypothetical protein CBS101457_000085 [Exobasidium rhododendri]|nr:hypothetical protein CBS101457_000085 [Exobasidium rhododendri]